VDNTVLRDLFHLNNNDWKIFGNKNVTDAVFRPYSLNGMMSHYIVGDDKVINVDHKNKDDANLWYFSKQFPTNFSLVNSSIFSFTMTSFSGNFANLNSPLSALIRVTNNVTNELIIFPVNHLINKYNGTIKEFVVPMVHSLWLNGRNYTQIGVKHFKQVLQNVKQIDILGDWTRGNETMGLDNVLIE
jgi:hypothetical protein